ncbi:formylglycine-generating enzyme family protein [Actinomadura verrucosospora]|uniref:Non-specific serine/threonine protein kinase n=1 Tax=Actinomadura verrucosospora TaxID=46165 RepID=A0A7D3ZKM9_ACTVE|nr:formylglycine-generating enzyme family protein [Actinomadura verrucosospora]QKG22321.1 non-specific serine/threonine protein kinase [Actinomadura verrucosospora]
MSCCQPQRAPEGTEGPEPVAVDAAPAPVVHDEVALPGGGFLMGDAFGEGYPPDGEGPVHPVVLDPFRIDATAVTNDMFAAFAAATGYRTEAERFGTSAVFHLAVAAGRRDVLGRAPSAPWWLEVRGADWAHPGGPRSNLDGLGDHPVVHVSHNDALAYCRWAGRRLPTEAEFEYASRGGRTGLRYPWGDELTPGGEHRANLWNGTFPSRNTLADGYLTTCPVRSFPPNGLGLYETSGNVWEWCADWFSPGYYRTSPKENPQGPERGTTRVTRGGSYLCHESYCNRYRVAARTSNTPDSSTGNCGFRTVAL